jgi:murein DD-endopeptidase MepM/ murein hydrolase activator NlpD
MLIVLFMLVFPVIFPETAHASLFSFLGSLVGQTASAQENTSTGISYNSQTLPLLMAPQNSKSIAATSTDAIVMADNAIIPMVGPSGSIADVDSQSPDIVPSFYVVAPGDNISVIADLFGVSVGTIKSANSLSAGSISPGQVLIIPPVSGLTYTVKKGDTISSVVGQYKASLSDVLEYNNMSSTSTLAIGDSIFLPGVGTGTTGSTGNTPIHISASTVIYEPYLGGGGPALSGPFAGGYYACPVIGSRLTQGLHGHNAVDLAKPIGSSIYAAADGTVIIAKTGGWNGGYGTYVVISHPNGTETLYAHAEKLLVTDGQVVHQGDTIARVGMTGETTGPHVHFEVRGAANPFVTVKC